MISRIKKSLSRRNSSKTSSSKKDSSSKMDVNEAPSTSVSFPQFPLLGDDIIRLVVSFVADAPLEQKLPGPITNQYRSAAMTSSLPFVNKQFYDIANSELLWEAALWRQLSKKESRPLWIGGLRRLLPTGFQLYNENSENLNKEQVEKLLRSLGDHLGEEKFRYKDIYMMIVQRHIKVEGPVFIMPHQLRLGEMYGLHLFEPRYRIMVREVLENCADPDQARRGGQIFPAHRNGVVEYPTLIHACMGRPIPGQLACLVQIVWCRTYEFGTADVQLLPVSWVKLDNVSIRPNTGHLFCAKGTRF